MRSVCAENVNYAYAQLLDLVGSAGVEVDTRNGKALTIEEPVFLEIARPCERVLFNKTRNCNPFFHVMEGLWMLSGRNDVEFVAQFNQGMRQYSDDGVTFNAAYGHRWRHHFGYDQIDKVCHLLSKDPGTRRCVISMWDGHEDLGGNGRDYPCNTSITCRVVHGALDFIINNRSNDLIFGLCGANAVHMSMLQEYMAHRIGVGVGSWFHLTTNLHVYEQHYPLLAVGGVPLYSAPYPQRMPLVQSAVRFDLECEELCNGELVGFKEPFIAHVAVPMALAWRRWKEGDYSAAVAQCYMIYSQDWRIACNNWIETAKEKKDAK